MIMRHARVIFGIIFFAIITLVSQDSFAKSEKKAEVFLHSSLEGVNNKPTLSLGLHFVMKKGWHTYWRSPGIVGYPAKLDWSGSENIKSTERFWPFPKRFYYLDIASHGYSDEVILPIMLTVEDPDKPVKIALKIDYLVCSDSECKPEEARLSLFLPKQSNERTGYADKIALFSGKVPELNPSQVLSFDPNIQIDHSSNTKATILIKAKHLKQFTSPEVFIESSEKFYTEAPKIKLLNNGQDAEITFSVFRNELKSSKPKNSLFTKDLRVSIKDGENLLTKSYSLSEQGASLTTFLAIFAAALLGGFILNFMPCVLPVLSIKLFSILKSRHENLIEIRKEFFITTSGIVASFIALGILAASLKSIGIQVGWGMQFQQPLFIASIVIILVLFSANLWNLFDFPMPRVLSRLGGVTSPQSKNLSHFLTGAFVTILATPCTAPFIATAISFSLSRGTAEILSIFFLMGIGLALPYIGVALFPKLAQHLPKPGTWILTLKKGLGLIVLLTALWFCHILFIQLGLSSLWLGGYFLILSALMTTLHYAKSTPAKKSLWALVILVLSILLFFSSFREVIQTHKQTKDWMPFNQSLIPNYTAQGNILFINVGADWCLTCKVNENLVLSKKEVLEFLRQERVIMMYADWTTPDKTITNFLKNHNEFAVPFYILYSKKYPSGLKLPQILTPDIVKNAVLKMKK